MAQPTTGATTHWRRFSAIRYLVIFGDSYSSVGYKSSEPHPTDEEPLGVPYPGITWTEELQDGNEFRCTPNWVGWLITEFAGGQNILVYDYAAGGNTVEDVVRQVQRQFLPTVGQKPEWAPWFAEDSLFVTWIGINDLAMARGEDWMRKKLNLLFEQHTALYNSGARNFLFIDVPPIHLSPAGGMNPNTVRGELYQRWNALHAEYVAKFASEHSNVTTMIFSSHKTFSELVEDPVKFGFGEDQARKYGGEMWMDHIHPTSKVHWIVARDIAAFLNAQSTPNEGPRA